MVFLLVLLLCGMQAVYGRIEGMYTRSQLMASLAEQKEHTLRLVGKVDELAGGLGDMEVCTYRYIHSVSLPPAG